MMLRRCAWCLLLSLGLHAFAAPAFAQGSITPESLTDEHVQKAISAIVEELYSRKHPDRLWEPEKIPAGDSTRQRGGYTAMVALALLHAGQSYQDPRLKDAIDYLHDFGMEGTYAVTLRDSVWAKLPPKFQDRLASDTQWLLDGFSEEVGGWDYVQDRRTRRKDNSIRQFGALALWEAAKRGAKVERRTWQRLEDALLEMQLPDGGWNYTGDGPATGSMTCAGLATLFITQDLLHANESIKLGKEQKASRYEQAIERGLAWMDEHFSATENPGRNTYFYYYLWGVERAGLASGYKDFGGHDWFREGAAELIRRVCKWDESAQAFTVHATTAGDGRASAIKSDDLAFALIFLSRGRVPVALNKLRFAGGAADGPGAWNNRPRDAANLARWIGDNTESEVNWQIVDLADEPEHWLDAPVLYVASNEALPFVKAHEEAIEAHIVQAREFGRRRDKGEIAFDEPPPAGPEVLELKKLKRFLDLGGMIFAVNEGNGRQFGRSVEMAGSFLYPQFAWRDLPEDHWAYTIHAQVKTRRPPLRALSNGVRELIILSPTADLAETFQSHDAKQQLHFEVATNIYFLASELNRPRPRLDQHFAREPADSAPAADAITLVRAAHEGNWNPEPLALSLFARWLKLDRKIDARIVDHPLAAVDKMEQRPALVIVSGTDAHTFTPQERSAIKSFVEAGGTILFETPGGRGKFTESAEEMAATLFNRPVEPLLRHRIISGEDLSGAIDLSRVEYRPFTLQTFGTRETTPRLRAMTFGEAKAAQPRMIFSREDLSHALLNQPCWGVSGYAPQSARDVLANLIQHSMSMQGDGAP